MGLEKQIIKSRVSIIKSKWRNSFFFQISKLSKRHLEYSINGNPNIAGQPTPSLLDLGGVNPTSANSNPTTISTYAPIIGAGTYANNLPLGTTPFI